MKKRILLIGVIGITTYLVGCSDDAPNPVASPVGYNESSSSTVTQSSSSSVQQSPTSSSEVTIGSSGSNTVYEKKIINVPAPDIDYPDIVDDKMFCWTPGCEATVVPPSSSSKATPKSSSQNAITIDAPENKPPVINGMTMTDARDNKTYKLMQIGGKLWMAQDIDYAGVTSECYNEQQDKCASNGRLYTFNSAQKAACHGMTM